MIGITHFRNSVVLFVCLSYRSGFVCFWSIDLQSILTSAGVGEAEAVCARLAVLPELIHGAASAEDRLEKVTLFGGNK